MNIILFSASEVQLPLARKDSRARHILEVLRRRPGETFDAGMINGPRGKGMIANLGEDSLDLTFTWDASPPPLAPIHLIVGLSRPQTCRDILREGATLGIARMDFVRTEKAEPSYAQSALWRSREWESLLVTGAAQAFCTRLPEVHHGQTLAEAVATLPANGTRVALDNYEASVRLGQVTLPAGSPVTLALGAERGWSAGERELLVQRGFLLAHLGERVLRTETACVAAVAVLKAKLGLL
ncbi:MAG TPA: RsmE family RNA methyltransferase [Lacunisphaera sp.]